MSRFKASAIICISKRPAVLPWPMFWMRSLKSLGWTMMLPFLSICTLPPSSPSRPSNFFPLASASCALCAFSDSSLLLALAASDDPFHLELMNPKVAFPADTTNVSILLWSHGCTQVLVTLSTMYLVMSPSTRLATFSLYSSNVFLSDSTADEVLYNKAGNSSKFSFSVNSLSGNSWIISTFSDSFFISSSSSTSFSSLTTSADNVFFTL